MKTKMRNENLPLKKRKLRNSAAVDQPAVVEAPAPPSPPPPAPVEVEPEPVPAKMPRINLDVERPPETSSPECETQSGEIMVVISKEERHKAQDLWCEIVLNAMYPEGHDFKLMSHVLLEKVEIPEHLLQQSEVESSEEQIEDQPCSSKNVKPSTSKATAKATPSPKPAAKATAKPSPRSGTRASSRNKK